MTESSAHQDHDGGRDADAVPARAWHDPQVGFAGLGRELVGTGTPATAAGSTQLTAGQLVGPTVAQTMLQAMTPARQIIAQQRTPLQATLGAYTALQESLAPTHLTATFHAVEKMLRPPLLELNLNRYLFGHLEFDMPWIDQLYPSGSILASVLRPLDLLTPALPDMSALFQNLVRTTSIVEGLWRDLELWRRLEDIGSAVALRAVRKAWHAALRFGPEALAWFVRDWLDRNPTPPRLEAACDVLLHLDWDELPRDGHAALAYLRTRLVARYRTTRLLLDTELRGGLIIAADAGGEREQLLTIPGPDMETFVLDALEPISDPRLHALLETLSPADQQVVLLKASTGCSWAAAAAECGRGRGYGEILRRRLDRRRTAMGLTSWT